MVAVCGDGSGRSAAKNLRVVELRMPRIAASDEDPADRIATSACKAALAGLEEAWVLVQNRRKDRRGHEIFNDAVSSGRPISLRIALKALSIGRCAVVCLTDRRQESPPRKLHRVERASGHYRKFLLRSQRRNLALIFQAQEVWQCIKKTVLRSGRGRDARRRTAR